MSEPEIPLSELVTYQDVITDTDKWQQFPHQPGDIFICTPSKNGTTWMQTIVTFLVFKTSDLNFVPAERSPWFDMKLVTIEQSLKMLKQDNERHIIKTHTPLDGVPFYSDAVYIGVYRDPRDAFFSMRNHDDNMKMDLGIPEMTVEEAFVDWLEKDFAPGDPEHCLGYPVHHLKCLWERQNLPNI